jgi:uncharacterized membrane protein YfcA
VAISREHAAAHSETGKALNAFFLAVFAVALVSGATASVVGFGIGSLLTPLIATRYGMQAAVALVAIPHAVATALRCWRLRASIDTNVLRRFGLLSAAGGLGGALLYAQLGSSTLTQILGALLILTAIAQLTQFANRWHPRGPMVGALGLASGFFGGVAGNQGGLRAAALSAFALTPAAFVATSTATGLLVDIARTPIYAWRAGMTLLDSWLPVAIASAGVLLGTIAGERVLLGMSRDTYARVLAVAILVLGVWLVTGARA